ncbi:MAG: SMC-Scp complex subunit ScpB [Pirellulales bacterium]|nr:SMC-Scp complex subunit ScpB [Pirellulales bacterium]
MSETSQTPSPAQPDDEPNADSRSAASPLTADDLGKAFAKMLDGASNQSDAGEESAASDDTSANDAAPPAPRQILEALLFVGTAENEPLSTDRLCQALQGVEPAELSELVHDLNREYARDARPYEIRTEAAGFRLTLRSDFERLRDKFYGKVRQARLSQAAVEVLAIVAYNQPISADEVNELRGTPSNPVLSQLVRRQLLRIERPDTKPRKAKYSTSDRFLELFRLDDVSELPRPVEAQMGGPG